MWFDESTIIPQTKYNNTHHSLSWKQSIPTNLAFEIICTSQPLLYWTYIWWAYVFLHIFHRLIPKYASEICRQIKNQSVCINFIWIVCIFSSIATVALDDMFEQSQPCALLAFRVRKRQHAMMAWWTFPNSNSNNTATTTANNNNKMVHFSLFVDFKL